MSFYEYDEIYTIFIGNNHNETLKKMEMKVAEGRYKILKKKQQLFIYFETL